MRSAKEIAEKSGGYDEHWSTKALTNHWTGVIKEAQREALLEAAEIVKTYGRKRGSVYSLNRIELAEAIRAKAEEIK